MTRAARHFLLLMLAGAVVVALGIAAALVWAVPYEHVTLTIDGQRIEMPPLDAGHWLAGSVVVLLVLAMLVLVVPLALVIGLALPFGLLALVLVAAALIAALALSPLLLLGWLVWRLVRPARDRTAVDSRG